MLGGLPAAEHVFLKLRHDSFKHKRHPAQHIHAELIAARAGGIPTLGASEGCGQETASVPPGAFSYRNAMGAFHPLAREIERVGRQQT